LAVLVTEDEARLIVLLDCPRRREAARAGHHGLAVSSTAVSRIAKVPMPIMTRTNSNNGMMLIKQLTGSDAERALVA
jgi:hypothetical protein